MVLEGVEIRDQGTISSQPIWSLGPTKKKTTGKRPKVTHSKRFLDLDVSKTWGFLPPPPNHPILTGVFHEIFTIH